MIRLVLVSVDLKAGTRPTPSSCMELDKLKAYQNLRKAVIRDIGELGAVELGNYELYQ
jgi:hypothetical protein